MSSYRHNLPSYNWGIHDCTRTDPSISGQSSVETISRSLTLIQLRAESTGNCTVFEVQTLLQFLEVESQVKCKQWRLCTRGGGGNLGKRRYEKVEGVRNIRKWGVI